MFYADFTVSVMSPTVSVRAGSTDKIIVPTPIISARFLFPGLPQEGGFIPDSERRASDFLTSSTRSDSNQQG